MSTALTGLSAEELEALGAALKEGMLRPPLSADELDIAGLGHMTQRASILFGHSEAATQALVSVALAERRSSRASSTGGAELVWTGPGVPGSTSRDTAVVVAELFASARRSVLIAGFSFDHGQEIFAPLHEVMAKHNVEAKIFLDITRKKGAKDDATVANEASIAVSQFLTANWPFGEPTPEVYYDPRTLLAKSVASLHAKCILIDDERTLVTSANFTDRGQSRNIEVGALVTDAHFAKQLRRQWLAAVNADVLLRAR